jgi:hypothetical protein
MWETGHGYSIVAWLFSTLSFRVSENNFRKTLLLNWWIFLVMVFCIWWRTTLFISWRELRWGWCFSFCALQYFYFLLWVVHNIIVVKKHRETWGTTNFILFNNLRAVSFQFRIIKNVVIECFWLYLNRRSLALWFLRHSQVRRAGILRNWRYVVSDCISNRRWRERLVKLLKFRCLLLLDLHFVIFQ